MREAALRADYLNDAKVTSVYLGGGTPSLLSPDELLKIFDTLSSIYSLAADAEVTLEANPDDLSSDYLNALVNTPINRLSIGIQSFSDAELRFMNRAHTAREATLCLERALAAGFSNITVDLIYGSPVSTANDWSEAIETVADFGVPHVSAYALTVEPRTALAHFIDQGTCAAVDEEVAAIRMEYLMERMEDLGYEQYEISNFALPGKRAVHNSSYWAGDPYLGLGPSAHSFDGQLRRQWNTANNTAYIQAIEVGKVPFEQEVLTPRDRYNEYVMTGLRTSSGCSMSRIGQFGPTYKPLFLDGIAGWVAQGMVVVDAENARLTKKGRLMADRIASDLFVTE